LPPPEPAVLPAAPTADPTPKHRQKDKTDKREQLPVIDPSDGGFTAIQGQQDKAHNGYV
jgi:hypothetical protein